MNIKTASHNVFKKELIIHFLTFLIVITSCSSELSFHRKAMVEKQKVNKDIQTDVQDILNEVIKDTKVNGIQLTVKLPSGEVLDWQSGYADVKKKVNLTGDHIMSWGSVTKMVTSTLILKLTEDGRLNLNDTISIWFPDFPQSNSITISHLLSHRSGVQNYMRYIPGLLKSFYFKYQWESDDLIKIASKGKLMFNPGSDFSYSNTNFVMLGRIAEKILDKPLNELFKEQIFHPQALDHIYFPPFDTVPIANAVYGIDKNFVPIPWKYIHKPNHKGWSSFANASGALVGTSNDMARFIDNLVTGKTISTEMFDKMAGFKPALVRDVPEQKEYGLGLEKILIDNEEYWGHIGSYIGFSAILIYSPKYKYSIALSCNYSIINTGSIVVELQKSILGYLLKQTGNNY